MEKSVVESPRGDGTFPRRYLARVRESARGGFWRLLAENFAFLRLFPQIAKNPLPRESNRRPPLLLHRGLSVRPDPQVFTRGECNNKGGPESFQISGVNCVLSSLNTLYQGIALSPATLRGASDCGSGLIFPENFANFWENVQKSGLEPATLGEVGPHSPLGHNILEYLLNDA